MITAGATPTPKTIDQRRVALTSPQVKTLQTDNAGTLGKRARVRCPAGAMETVGGSGESSLSFLAMKIIFGVCAGGTWFSVGRLYYLTGGSAGRRVLVDVEEVGES